MALWHLHRYPADDAVERIRTGIQRHHKQSEASFDRLPQNDYLVLDRTAPVPE
jgi:hypothetical protein